MKKKYVIATIIWLLVEFLSWYIFLPAINLTSIGFWAFIIFALIFYCIIFGLATFASSTVVIKKNKNPELPMFIAIPLAVIVLIPIAILFINFIASPLFNARSYSERIVIDETGDFLKDIEEVDFNKLPLLDRKSSEKLGDRVMGQMSEFVSQFYVSDQYTQINYNNDIIRVTPLEYGDLIKWFNHKGEGIKGYIKVNSVNGASELVKLDKGMKYMPSAYFNSNLRRKLRFAYPTTIFAEPKFEIDNDGKPYWIVPTVKYTAIGLKKKVTGVVILDPVTGDSKKYDMKDVPSWVDNAYDASLIIEQVDDWGTYKKGFWNSIFGQNNVVNTTEGYNYLAMNDDIYLYTGITSVLSDESNLGFILSNMRTGETTYYQVAGAEEYSAMSSAEGQVQQMKYKSTFPLLINLNNKPTYLVSLKDAAGLVKMYGFVDVTDYQKVTVTDASKGIEQAAQNYLSENGTEVNDDVLIKEEITIDRITSVSIDGTTYYYITSGNKKFKASVKLSDNLPFINVKDKITIGYHSKNNQDIINIEKIY